MVVTIRGGGWQTKPLAMLCGEGVVVWYAKRAGGVLNIPS